MPTARRAGAAGAALACAALLAATALASSAAPPGAEAPDFDAAARAARSLLADLVFGDPELTIAPSRDFSHAPPSPLDGPVPAAIRKVAAEVWPGAPIVHFMGRAATDSRHLRGRGVASYGMGPIAVTEADGRRAHGIDERIPAASLRPGVEFLYRLVVELAGRETP